MGQCMRVQRGPKTSENLSCEISEKSLQKQVVMQQLPGVHQQSRAACCPQQSCQHLHPLCTHRELDGPFLQLQLPHPWRLHAGLQLHQGMLHQCQLHQCQQLFELTEHGCIVC